MSRYEEHLLTLIRRQVDRYGDRVFRMLGDAEITCIYITFPKAADSTTKDAQMQLNNPTILKEAISHKDATVPSMST